MKADRLEEVISLEPAQDNTGKYSVILCDAPWAYKSARTLQGKGSHLTAMPGQHYETTDSKNLRDIGKHLHQVVEDDSILFMWSTGPVLAEAIELMGRRNRIPRPYKRSSARQYIENKKTGHSVKPEDIQDRIEKMFSTEDHNHLELFARRHREGWECLGVELSGNDIRMDLDLLHTKIGVGDEK